jgi:DNA-binding IclR family transcriptional regulator
MSMKSLARALDILSAFGLHAQSLTVPEIGARAGLPRSSVYRFLATFVKRGFLVERQERRYAVGPEILRLGEVALGRAELHRYADPVMQRIVDKTGESVCVLVRHGLDAVCIGVMEGPAKLRFQRTVGDSSPLQAGSGKVILAFLQPAARERALKALDLRPRPGVAWPGHPRAWNRPQGGS